MHRLVAFLLLLGALIPATAASPVAPDQEIEALLGYVASLEGAVFIRNGSEHTCKEAAAHLRLKWDRQRAKIDSAGKFIELCATKSSVSGQPYRIRLADGTVRLAADALREHLRLLKTSR